MVTTPNYDLDIDTTLGGSNASDYVIPSQKAIKDYVDNHSGSGGITIDNETITKNTSGELQSVAVIDSNEGETLKTWTGTKAQYDAITTKDPDTLYYITDDNTASVYEAYTKDETDTLLRTKADQSTTYTKTETNNQISNVVGQMRGATFVNLCNGSSNQSSGVITLNDSIQNYPILLFHVGAVSSYNYSVCVAMPFSGRVNSFNSFAWAASEIDGECDVIRLNFTYGQTTATPAMITLQVTTATQLTIKTNTSSVGIRGIFGVKFT